MSKDVALKDDRTIEEIFQAALDNKHPTAISVKKQLNESPEITTSPFYNIYSEKVALQDALKEADVEAVKSIVARSRSHALHLQKTITNVFLNSDNFLETEDAFDATTQLKEMPAKDKCELLQQTNFLTNYKIIHEIALLANDEFLKSTFEGLSKNQREILLETLDSDKWSPLHFAAQRGSAAAINNMLEDLKSDKKIELLMQPNANGKTPIFLVAKYAGQKALDDVMQEIVGEGKKINEQSLREKASKENGSKIIELYRDAKSGLGEKIRKRRINAIINALCGTNRELGSETITEMKAKQNALGNAIRGSRMDKIKSYIR